MRKSFFDSAEATKTLQGIPKDDLLRILSVIVSPQLLTAFAEMTDKWEQVDLALLAVSLCHSFHAGYSTAIADLTKEPPTSLHLEYLNEQQRSAGSPGANPAAAGPAIHR